MIYASRIWLSLILSCVSIVAAAEPTVGQLPPPLTLQHFLQPRQPVDTDWNSLRGNVVVLEFWATWCGPCVEAILHLNELAEKYKDAPVRFIMITAEDEPVVTAFLAKNRVVPWVALDNGATFGAYAAQHIPTMVVIDRNGVVAAVTEPSLLRAGQIDDLLAGRAISMARKLPSLAQNNVPGEFPGGENPDSPPLFEVKLRKASHRFESESSDQHGVWTLASTTPQKLYALAYNTTPPHIVQDVPLPDGAYDLAVRSQNLSEFEILPMLRPALDATFRVKATRQPREVDAYVMTRTDASAAALQTAPKTLPQPTAPPVATEMRWSNAPSALLVSLLEYRLGRPIVDESHLTERYNFDVIWDPDAKDVSAAVLQAVHDQLGLQLTPAKRKIDAIVIDHP